MDIAEPFIVQMGLNAFRREKRPTVGLFSQLQRIDIGKGNCGLLQQIHSKVLVVLKAPVDNRHGIGIELAANIEVNRSLDNPFDYLAFFSYCLLLSA